MVFHSSTFNQLVILFFVNKREVTVNGRLPLDF